MGIINVLPEQVVNKIAAGEVIERPASVVKELVENALDAEASRITIEIEDGGKKLIRVTDDGKGMAHDDLAVAFHGHATSKLRTDDDLFSVATFGFRGEALTSIGAVAHARIVSRPPGAIEAGEIEMKGGKPGPVKAKGAPEGTTIEAANLFFNVPARRKFLRTDRTEYAHIVEHVSRVALAHPEVAFRLVHNGRETLALPATADRRRRLGDLYGRELAEALLEVDSGDGPVSVTGFVAPPVHCRSNRKMQLTYVNGRFVRHRRLNHAIAAAYEGLLVQGRFPVAVLFVRVDPGEVDVNVHPTKIEVRFSRGDQVHRAVLGAVRQALRSADLTPVFQPPERSGRTGGAEPGGERRTFRMEQSSEWTRGGHTASMPFERRPERPDVTATADREPGGEPTDAPPAEEPDQPRCFQVRNSYIIEERADGIAIIDQHALHERILFETIRDRIGRAKLESQRLLVPAVIELGKADAARLLAEQETLALLGIELAEFGDDSIAVNAVPAVLARQDPEQMVHDLLAELSGDLQSTPVEERKLAMAKIIACKAAVKAGDRLTRSEVQSLLERGRQATGRDTCPHGRPTCIVLPYDDLERRFRRK